MENLDQYLFGGMFILAGVLHFIFPKPFSKIVPPSIPRRKLMVYLSGAFEIIFGIGIYVEFAKHWTAIGLILLLIAVFPANVYMAQRFKQKGHRFTWAAYLRLPLQLVLIYWALLYTNWF